MSSSKKKLFLLDAMALIYRAHFAFSKSPRVTSTGINTSAVLGFTNALLEVLTKEKPSHIGVAFDTAAPTFRHEAFKEYKANRQDQPEDIAIAIPYIIRMLQCFNIPVIMMDGYEADDIIGTLSSKACQQGFQVYMMTMDKDYCQLVNECVFLYKPSYMGSGHEVYDVEKVLDKFQIKKISQVRDILGLQGDAVDNIPGIPGIGEKTAQKLIAEFETIENLVANADLLKGKLRENVIKYADQGILSKELATIHLNVPIDFEEETFFYKGPHKDALSILCDELEFRTLKKRILGEEGPDLEKRESTTTSGGQMSLFDNPATTIITNETVVPEKKLKDINSVLHDYYLVNTVELRLQLIHFLFLQEEFCFDTETTSLEAVEAAIVGMSFCYKAGEAYYVPIPTDQAEAKLILEEFKQLFLSKNITKIGQNIKYDLMVLQNYGIEVSGPFFDTMVAHYLIEPDMRHNMDVLSQIYLHYNPVSIEELIGKKGIKQKNMKDVPLELVTDYAAEDADVTFQLKQVFSPKLKELKIESLFYEVEVPLISVLAGMEVVGVKINPQALQEFSKELDVEIKNIEQLIYNEAGCQFNISSPKQLGDILFDKLKIDLKAKKTKTGQYATGEDVLSKLALEHTIAKQIIEYRELQKLKNTYVDALPLLISEKDGRIHTCYNQAVAATGRLSSTNPNLQNIPIRTERGREIRKAFMKRDNQHVILSADYSQIELRIMAAFSKEGNMIQAFKNNIDIHSTTASKVFKVELAGVTSDMRRKAKMVNFGIIYGISAFGLAQRLDIPRREAGEIIEAYFTEFPAIKTYMDSVINVAREQEYVETILGRRRYVKDINSRNITLRGYAERNAINAPIQGSAADMIKIAMINIHKWMKEEKLQSSMIMQVHDELVFDVRLDEVEIVKQKVEELMKNSLILDVPMEIGIGIGDNWLEAH